MDLVALASGPSQHVPGNHPSVAVEDGGSICRLGHTSQGSWRPGLGNDFTGSELWRSAYGTSEIEESEVCFQNHYTRKRCRPSHGCIWCAILWGAVEGFFGEDGPSNLMDVDYHSEPDVLDMSEVYIDYFTKTDESERFVLQLYTTCKWSRYISNIVESRYGTETCGVISNRTSQR